MCRSSIARCWHRLRSTYRSCVRACVCLRCVSLSVCVGECVHGMLNVTTTTTTTIRGWRGLCHVRGGFLRNTHTTLAKLDHAHLYLHPRIHNRIIRARFLPMCACPSCLCAHERAHTQTYYTSREDAASFSIHPTNQPNHPTFCFCFSRLLLPVLVRLTYWINILENASHPSVGPSVDTERKRLHTKTHTAGRPFAAVAFA